MAKYEVEHTCGHTETHNLTGPHKNREWWLENVGPGRLCSDCFETERQKQYAEQSAQAQEAAKSSGLPELTGSPKQIAWAETLRAAFLKSLDGVDELSAARDAFEYHLFEGVEVVEGSQIWKFQYSPEAEQEMRDAGALIKSEPRERSEARWWIDNRNQSGRQYYTQQLEARKELLCPTAAAEVARTCEPKEVSA